MERPQYDFSAVKPLVVFAIASLFAGKVLAQASGGQVAENLRRNVVRIEAKFGEQTENGFGFIVGERGNNLYIVTANHVVYPQDPGEPAPKTVKVEFFDYQGQTFDATVLGTHDIPRDLAVLTLPRPVQDFQWTKQCLGRAETPKRATEVWFIGKSQKWYVPLTAGRVASEDTGTGMLLESMSIQPGSSGGPLLDATGIVGIVLRDSAENSAALHIDAVKSFLDEKNHPFNLERGAAAAPVVAEAPKPAATPVVEAPAPVAPASVPAASPLQEGYYEIYRLNGEPQQGVLMHIEKASDDHFLATATTAGDSGWSGELLRSGDAWELNVPDLRGRRRAPEGTPLNPGNGKNEISREGPLLTFKSGSAIFVWKKTDKTSIERAPRPEPQPSSASINGASILGALVSGFVATQTPRPVRQPNQCVAGYVWREAGPDDRVCVTPETHDRTAIENSRAAANRYADGRCFDGYVWREAFYGDRVCVSLRSREQVARDNDQAGARVMH